MTIAVIAPRLDALYARDTMPRKSDTTPEQRIALQQRLDAGEWLRIGEAAKVLNLSRSKVDLMMKAGDIRTRLVVGSRYRECDPRDLQRLLADARHGITTKRPEVEASNPDHGSHESTLPQPRSQ